MVSSNITVGGIMIRLLVVIMMVIGAISFVTTLEGATKEKQRPVNWQPIYGFKMQGAKAFFDANSQTTRVHNNTEFKSSLILIIYDSAITEEINGKKYTFRSMVKSLLTECTTGLTAPMTDMYFTEERPTRQSLPVTGLDYSNIDVRVSSVVLPKGTPLHGTLCPTYI